MALSRRLPDMSYTMLMDSPARPADFFTSLVKDFLVVLGETRKADIMVSGKQFRSIQLGLLKLPLRTISF